jgi:nicotinamide riboside kinase
MRIGFCGTMSVGKTTLVNELKKLDRFKDYQFATERSAYLNSLGIPLNYDTTIEGQTVFLAERVSELMQPKIITDRTIIDVIAFTQTAKKISYIDGDAFTEYAKRFIRQYDLIIYLSAKGIDIEDNGVRNIDLTYRKEIDETIQKLLNKHRPVFFALEGSVEERVEAVCEILDSEFSDA